MRRIEREIKDLPLIEEIINKADVCRLGIANNDVPYIVAMNFGYEPSPEPVLYFHCAPVGRKLDMIKRNNRVCFQLEVDHEIFSGEKGCDWGAKFRSVVGYGDITFITSKDEKITAFDCIMKHYAGGKKYEYDDKVLERTAMLKLTITEMTAKNANFA